MKHRLCTLVLACGVAATGLAQTTSSTDAGKPASSPAGTTSSAQPNSSTPATASTGAAQSQTPAPPAHPITTAQTREMFELMGYKNMMDNMLAQTIAMQKQQAPFVPADVWTDFQNSFNGVDYVALLQPIYAKYISEEEAAKSLEFYRTPAGRHMLQSMPMLMREIMVTSQQNGQKVGRAVIDRHRAEIEAAQKKYQQEQQPAAPPANGGSGATPSGAGSPSGSGAGATPGGSRTTPPPTGTQSTPPAGPSTTQPK